MTVHNHPPYEPICNERTIDGQLRGACLTDDGQPATVCTGADTCDAPTHVHGCYADFLGHCDNPTDHDPRPAPAYLDPLHDELDRLRTENANLVGEVETAAAHLEQAEARVNSLHTQLDEQIAFNRQRSDALNRTAANNDQLRATIARVEALHRKTYDSPSDEAYQRNAVCDNCEVSWPCGTVAALADQEPASE